MSKTDTICSSSGTKSAIFWKQFKLNFFGSIWVIETQTIWSRDFFFQKCRINWGGGISIFWAIFDFAKVNGI